MGVVVDASVVLSWVIPDEASLQSSALLDRLYGQKVIVPSIWSYEIANGLLFSYKSKRMSAQDIDAAYRFIRSLNLECVSENPIQNVVDLKAFAVESGLTVYDSAYLHLAILQQCPIATFDKKLLAAATKAGISVWAE